MSENKLIDFNLNDYVHVKLTEKGKIHLLDHWREIFKGTTIETPKIEVDKEGYTKFQGWEFMQYFGKSLRQSLYELTIKIEVKNE